MYRHHNDGRPDPVAPRATEGEQGGSGLWVNDELVKAIRTESAAALRYWFGVSTGVVQRWRKAFGVSGRLNTTRGTERAVRQAAQKGEDAIRAKDWTDEELDAKVLRSKRLGLKPPGRWVGQEWTAEEGALLGTDDDGVIASRVGRAGP